MGLDFGLNDQSVSLLGLKVSISKKKITNSMISRRKKSLVMLWR